MLLFFALLFCIFIYTDAFQGPLNAFNNPKALHRSEEYKPDPETADWIELHHEELEKMLESEVMCLDWQKKFFDCMQKRKYSDPPELNSINDSKDKQ